MDLEQELKRERQIEQKLEEKKAEENFRDSLSQVKNFDEALSFVENGPKKCEPGYASYHRLGTFLETQIVPVFASKSEKNAYIELVGKMREKIETSVIADLQKATTRTPF